MNAQLSQDRADAVLTALRARRVPVSTFTSVGFGEDNPIADNDTEEGREANRRIEFSLIVPETTAEDTSALDDIAQDIDIEIADEEPVADPEATPAETE
jgi:OOP family OmpA-OmpF porin